MQSHEIMVRSLEDVLRINQGAKVDMRVAACILAIGRVAEATMMHSI